MMQRLFADIAPTKSDESCRIAGDAGIVSRCRAVGRRQIEVMTEKHRLTSREARIAKYRAGARSAARHRMFETIVNTAGFADADRFVRSRCCRRKPRGEIGLSGDWRNDARAPIGYLHDETRDLTQLQPHIRCSGVKAFGVENLCSARINWGRLRRNRNGTRQINNAFTETFALRHCSRYR